MGGQLCHKVLLFPIPVVYRWPYDYSKPNHQEDYIPQHIPFSATMESNMPYDFRDDPEAEKIQVEWKKKISFQ